MRQAPIAETGRVRRERQSEPSEAGCATDEDGRGCGRERAPPYAYHFPPPPFLSRLASEGIGRGGGAESGTRWALTLLEALSRRRRAAPTPGSTAKSEGKGTDERRSRLREAESLRPRCAYEAFRSWFCCPSRSNRSLRRGRLCTSRLRPCASRGEWYPSP